MIRVVLGIVLYLEILLVIRGLLQRGGARRRRRATRRCSPGLVPNGLFVSIAVAYALGAIRILRFGALVQQSNAIEIAQPRRRPVPRQDRHADREPARGGGRRRARRRRGGRGDRALARPWPRARPRPTRPARRSPRTGRRTPQPTRGRGAVLVGPEVERGGVRDGPAPVVALGARAVPPAVPRSRRGRRGRPLWPAIERDRRRVDRARACACCSCRRTRTPQRCRTRDDEATATLPPGMRPLGLVALRDELRGEAARDAARVHRGRRRRQDHLGRRPGHRRRAGAPGRASTGDLPRSPGPDLDALDDARARPTCASDDDRLRPDHAGPEGAAGRRAARRGATTSR